MLVRGTETNAFVHALFGDIGGFGVGGHGAVELGIPLGARTSLLLGGRVMGEVYSQASGWEIGPTAGIRY
jgi:hypothetical protein